MMENLDKKFLSFPTLHRQSFSSSKSKKATLSTRWSRCFDRSNDITMGLFTLNIYIFNLLRSLAANSFHFTIIPTSTVKCLPCLSYKPYDILLKKNLERENVSSLFFLVECLRWHLIFRPHLLGLLLMGR